LAHSSARQSADFLINRSSASHSSWLKCVSSRLPIGTSCLFSTAPCRCSKIKPYVWGNFY
jgi:hypothetical protein